MLFHFSSFPSQCGVQRMGESPSQPELSAIKCFKPETIKTEIKGHKRSISELIKNKYLVPTFTPHT